MENYRVVEGHLMVVMQCLCSSDPVTMFIRGIDVMATCPKCQSQYMIAKAEFDRTTVVGRNVSIAVGRVSTIIRPPGPRVVQ